MLANVVGFNLYLTTDINTALNYFYNVLRSTIKVLVKKVFISHEISNMVRALIIENKRTLKSISNQKLLVICK